jgi:uncharacterized protein YndB with AHSA1/START domain
MGSMRTRHFSLYVAAARERVWQALTDPALTRRYYFGLAVESDWQPGSPIVYRGCGVPAALTGEIVQVEPAGRLVHSLLSDADPDGDVETWVSWEISEPEPGLCRVSLTCDDLDRFADPERDEAWCRLLSGLKTLLETGTELAAAYPESARTDDAG